MKLIKVLLKVRFFKFYTHRLNLIFNIPKSVYIWFMPKDIEILKPSTGTETTLPFVGGISAGFPSPADDFLETGIDLNKELIKHPASTFVGRVKSDSLRDLHIVKGDLLVIDKSLEPKNGKIAVCYLDGEFTAKRIKIEKDCIWLLPANENYKPIKVTADNDFIIWGIVTKVIKDF
jgi:DNA polymerase V